MPVQIDPLPDQATADAVVDQALCRIDQVRGLPHIYQQLEQHPLQLRRHLGPLPMIDGIIIAIGGHHKPLRDQ